MSAQEKPRSLWKEWLIHLPVIITILFGMVLATWTIKSDIHSVDQRLSDKISDLNVRMAVVENQLQFMQNMLNQAYAPMRQANNEIGL